MTGPFRYQGAWELEPTPDALWGVLACTDDYPGWWPWLESFRSAGLRAGTTSTAVIRSPLGYRLRVAIDILEVVPGRRLVTEVRGDLAGPAQLELAPYGERTTAQLTWALELRQRALRTMLPVARPVMEWGHDRIIERALAEFQRRALAS